MLFFVLFGIAALCSSNDRPVVETKYGKIEGIQATNSNGKNYYSFKGIPYAQPPVDKLRWQRPQPPTPWGYVLDASKDGGTCIHFDAFGTKTVTGSEDCLYLNVYVPEKPESLVGNEKPVMVWIHGGGYNFGTGAEFIYGAGKLMDHDVIVVSINYRLGVFGFLSTGDDALPGNYGMWDQVEALKWVQQNIKAFGGDPEKVTIFGESAGSGSVSLHLFSERSKGLFNKAIMQSGTVFSPWAIVEDPRRSFKAMAKNLNCPSESTQEFSKCMQTKPMEEVFNAYFNYTTFPETFPILFGPVIESKKDDSSFLSDHPTVLLKESRYNEVPVMLGFNTNEGELLSLMASGGYNDFDKDFFEKKFEEYVTRLLDFKHPQMPQVANLLKKKYFSDVTDWNDKSQTRTPLNTIGGDAWFSYPSVILASNLVKYGNEDTYLYHFSYFGKVSFTTLIGPPHAASKDRGPTHADELQYLFDCQAMFGKAPLEGKDLEMSKILLTLWTNFAKTGNPTSNKSSATVSLPDWKRVTEDSSNYLDIGETLQMKSDYESERMKLWDSILPKLESGEKISFNDEL